MILIGNGLSVEETLPSELDSDNVVPLELEIGLARTCISEGGESVVQLLIQWDG